MKYPLNVKRDVDHDGHPDDEDCGYILNLIYGWKFAGDPCASHVKSYDSMKDLRADLKHGVEKCDCKECIDGLANDSSGDCE